MPKSLLLDVASIVDRVALHSSTTAARLAASQEIIDLVRATIQKETAEERITAIADKYPLAAGMDPAESTHLVSTPRGLTIVPNK